MTKRPVRLAKKKRVLLTKFALHLLAIGLGIIFILPFLWMITTSLKVPAQIWVFPPEWIPRPLHLTNYKDAIRMMNFAGQLSNTVVITATTMVGVLLSCTLVAYGFARFRFRGKKFLFTVLLATMMLPSQVTIIPQFIVFTKLGWVNTFKPLIIPAFFGIPFYIFLLRQFFMTIPRELDEAAIIDGCSYPVIFSRIMLPLSKPAVATVAIFHFMGVWNDFFGPLLYLNDMDKYTLAIGLASFRGLYSTYWGPMMAASLMVMLPCLALFFFAQQYFIQGITLTGIKG